MIPLYSRVPLPRKAAVCNQLFLSFVRRGVPILPSFSFKVELVFGLPFFSRYCAGSPFCSHPGLLFCFLFSFCHPQPPPPHLFLHSINLLGRSIYLFLSNSLSGSAYPQQIVPIDTSLFSSNSCSICIYLWHRFFWFQYLK